MIHQNKLTNSYKNKQTPDKNKQTPDKHKHNFQKTNITFKDSKTLENLQNFESIYKFGLSVCLFVSNKRQNG